MKIYAVIRYREEDIETGSSAAEQLAENLQKKTAERTALAMQQQAYLLLQSVTEK